MATIRRSYGVEFGAAYRQVGTYAGCIFDGAKPGDLPVVQVKSIALAVNVTTANVLKLAIPQSILARADEVIE